MADIPIVGQPGTVLFWYPTVITKCNCKPNELTLIVTTGFGNPSICPKCNSTYVMRGVRPDGKGGLDPIVDHIPPVPKGQVM